MNVVQSQIMLVASVRKHKSTTGLRAVLPRKESYCGGVFATGYGNHDEGLSLARGAVWIRFHENDHIGFGAISRSFAAVFDRKQGALVAARVVTDAALLWHPSSQDPPFPLGP